MAGLSPFLSTASLILPALHHRGLGPSEWDAADPPAFRVFIDAHDFGGMANSGFVLSVNEDGHWEGALGLGNTT